MQPKGLGLDIAALEPYWEATIFTSAAIGVLHSLCDSLETGLSTTSESSKLFSKQQEQAVLVVDQ